jgi:hypothetical protein
MKAHCLGNDCALMWLKIVRLVKTCNTGRGESAAQTGILEGIVTNSEF